ncbi:hypothetical protein WJX75_007718 [Coccomyxa subellipsoidea]|uniref:Uncharacterized protein n=1 Tax=Coccomyxa subellipsoidea TaxID=248742 RepID=A0ABR2YLB5_9CHLO
MSASINLAIRVRREAALPASLPSYNSSYSEQKVFKLVSALKESQQQLTKQTYQNIRFRLHKVRSSISYGLPEGHYHRPLLLLRSGGVRKVH